MATKKTGAPEAGSVFAALVEVVPTPGCALLSGEAIGAFARCYVPANDQQRAVATITQQLENECLRVVEVLWCVRDDDADWEQPDSVRAQECIRDARASGKMIIGRLDSFEADA